jgi:hypothetical protein
MDSFHFDFETDSTLTNDTCSTSSDLDWNAFQSAPPAFDTSPVASNWLGQVDDAVAPDNRSTLINNSTAHDDSGLYLDIEHFFTGLNTGQQSGTIEGDANHFESIQATLSLSEPPSTRNESNPFETTVSQRHCSSA